MKELKEKGARTAGIFCSFVPVEILMAGGVVNASLCASSEQPIPAAETKLPRNLLPVNQGQLWLCADRYLPYFYFADLIVGETDLRRKEK